MVALIHPHNRVSNLPRQRKRQPGSNYFPLIDPVQVAQSQQSFYRIKCFFNTNVGDMVSQLPHGVKQLDQVQKWCMSTKVLPEESRAMVMCGVPLRPVPSLISWSRKLCWFENLHNFDRCPALSRVMKSTCWLINWAKKLKVVKACQIVKFWLLLTGVNLAQN